MPEVFAPDKPPTRRGRDRRRGRPARTSAAPTYVTTSLLALLVIGTPLACGAVHRPTFFITTIVAALLALATAWLATRSRGKLAATTALAFPLFFLVVAATQLIPLPPGLRVFLDAKGSALLALAGLGGPQPLSLDPPQTYRELAKAAAALSVGLAALVLASGRRLRLVAPGLVATAGLLALATGLGHRAAAESMVYGHFATSGGLPVGPFINPNHSAEFFELSAFAALAFAFSRSTRDGQRIWKVIAALLAAGAISTMSRGSILALGAGALTWFTLAPRSDEGEPLHRSKFVAALLALVVVVGLAIGLGGDKIIDEFRGSVGDNLSKFALSKDALSIVSAHPAGIGLGAFSRVYPVYQTLPASAWFQFVENQPLGILIEAGMAATVLLLGLWLLVARRFWKQARRDRVEASLAAGLVAILAHNVVDFGLETFGVLLPFCAVLGTLFGRQPTASDDLADSPVPAASSASAPPLPAKRAGGRGGARPILALSSVAFLALLASVLLLRSPAARDFDVALAPPVTASHRFIAHAASQAHPTDYAYALAEARLSPPATQSRLRMLNRAMLLCPRCLGAHEEAARDLWRIGRRSQSLLEWKTVITEARPSLGSILDGLLAVGAKPEELATLTDDENRFAITRYLLAHGAIEVAKTTLGEAAAQDRAERYLVEAQIALAAKDIPSAKRASQRALELEPRNLGATLLAADLALLDSKGADQAMSILQTGLRFAPSDVQLNRKMLFLLLSTDKSQATDLALANLRAALAEAGMPSTEANIAAAQIFEKRGQFRRAMSEYQAALAQTPDNIDLRLSLAHAAEEIGGITTAVDAYSDVLRREPGNQTARSALARIQIDKRTLEVDSILHPHTGGEDR